MSHAVKDVGFIQQWDSSTIKKFLTGTTWTCQFSSAPTITFGTVDLTYLQEHEADTFIVPADDYKLDKPLCVIYVDKLIPLYTVNDSLIGDIIVVEHQLVVNFLQGKLYLDGYMALLEELYKTDRDGDLVELGLKSLTMERGDVVDGGELYNSLQRKLLIQSLIVNLQIL